MSSMSIAVLIFTAFITAPSIRAELDGFDGEDDEPEQQQRKIKTPKRPNPSSSTQQMAFDDVKVEESNPERADQKEETATPAKTRRAGREFIPQKHYYYEMGALASLVLYLIMYLVGARQNSNLASKWADAFSNSEGIFHKEFSLVGAAGDKYAWAASNMTKESASEWKLYCSGRQYCKYLTATLRLKNRQDLYSYLWHLIYPTEDMVAVEVLMNEEAMEPLVLVVGVPKVAKALKRNNADVEKYTVSVDGPPDHRRAWIAPKLQVYAESWEVADTMLVDSVVGSVLSEEALRGVGRYFQCMYFSDCNPDPQFKTNKKVLSFQFKMPKDPTEMTKLMEMVPRYIDLVGRSTLSAKAKDKATKNREATKAEAFRDTLNERQLAFQRKKQEKKEAEEAAEANMSREQLRKKEEKMRKRALKKQDQKHMKVMR